MSPASYALRFATGFDGMMMVLSGMSDMAQMQKSSKVKTLFHVLLVVTVWKNVQRTLLFQIDLPA